MTFYLRAHYLVQLMQSMILLLSGNPEPCFITRRSRRHCPRQLPALLQWRRSSFQWEFILPVLFFTYLMGNMDLGFVWVQFISHKHTPVQPWPVYIQPELPEQGDVQNNNCHASKQISCFLLVSIFGTCIIVDSHQWKHATCLLAQHLSVHRHLNRDNVYQTFKVHCHT